MSLCDPGLVRAFVRWQHGAGPYWPYVCAAPFLGAPPARGRLPIRDASCQSQLATLVDAIPVGQRAAIYVDLPPTETLAATAELTSQGFRVVPIVQRWIAQNAVLPCGPLQQQLVAHAPRGPAAGANRGVVFLLDGDRAGPHREDGHGPSVRLFDNRYGYRICRFPPPRLLLRNAIKAVVWLSASGIAPDLRGYADGLVGAGLSLDEVPLPPRLLNESRARSRP